MVADVTIFRIGWQAPAAIASQTNITARLNVGDHNFGDAALDQIDRDARQAGTRDGDSPMDRARQILEIVSAEAAGSEAKGQLTDETMAALHRSGLFRLLVPRCFGGLEAGALEALETLEMLCEADGSTGWVVMACNVAMGTAATFLPEAGADAIFASRLPLIAGQGAPRGRAVVDGNGYRLSGRWSYGSGVLHAEYLHTGGLVYENGAPSKALTFIVPIEHAKLLGNWDVVGLRATGSVDYALDNVYVPKEFTHSPDTQTPLRGSDLYRIGIVGLSPLAHGAFALGVGRRVLTELASLAMSAEGRPAPLVTGAAGESFQDGYGVAEGKLRAGRAFLYEVYGQVEATLKKGDPVSMRQISLMRLSLNHATSAAADVCTFAYHAGGGVALRSGILQRCFLDMMAGAQHRIVSSYMLRECARELLGLAKDKMWTSAGLVDLPKSTGSIVA
jgi:indole-3-acetate monooxygenase